MTDSPTDGAGAADRMARSVTLTAPPGASDRFSLEITVGPLAPGQALRVASSSGGVLGTISPFGPASRGRSATYALPIDARELRGGALSVTLTVQEAGRPPRAPTAGEVEDIRLVGGAPPD